MRHICHITPEHYRYDTRIFLKECTSLANAGYNVSLIVCDGEGNEVKNKVTFFDIGKKGYSAFQKQVLGGYKALRKAISLDADVYHFHDHSFIIPAIYLLLKGKKVILDAHEDTPAEILNRTTQQTWKKVISYSIYKSLDIIAPRYFSAIIGATGSIKEKFLKKNRMTVEVSNYPILTEFNLSEEIVKENKICYIGGIFRIRGIIELIKALEETDTTLILAGKFEDLTLEKECRKLRGWQKVEYRGFLNRQELAQVFGASMAGLVTFLPGPNHNNSQPNKMYEYMSAGLPIIVSNFSLWKSFVDKNQCGICVDPTNPSAIADGINSILTNPIMAQQMGKNGKRAVLEKYNWSNEERKLISLYNSIFTN